jgi:putative transposase
MARPLRIEYPDACYHVINRGNQRAVVFHDDWHYERFIEKLGYFATEFCVFVHAYCCMPNHFHLYLRTKEANLSRFMQSFLTSFCVSSNKKRRTTGHIFQGRFKAHLVDDELYRSRLSRYIHLNPIRQQALRDAGPEERHKYLRGFKWSSYPSYIGITKKVKWLDCGPILSCWGKNQREQIANYAVYVEEGLLKDVESPFDDIVEQSIIGGDRFVDWVKREYLLIRSGDKKEEPALFHLQQSFSFDDVITHVARYFGIDQESVLKRKCGHREARRLAMYCACIYCRHIHSLSDMAAHFSVSGSALTQAADSVVNDSSPHLGKALKDLKNIITKT